MANNRPQITQAAASSRITDGTFHIKSNTSDVYLTCPQDEDSMVAVQKSDPFSDSQKVRHRYYSSWYRHGFYLNELLIRTVQWRISLIGDGAYSIVGRRGNLEVPLCAGDGNELVCDSSGEQTFWTIEPRGDTYVSVASSHYHLILCTHRLRTGSETLRTPR